jgi:hypothetical protein
MVGKADFRSLVLPHPCWVHRVRYRASSCAVAGEAVSESAATAPGRTPTERQFEILMQLGSGAVLLTGRKREVDPLLRHGWVTADHGYAWVRITAAGLHALARAVEKYGLPEMTRGKRYAKVCAECGREWRPKCRCGGQSYRFEHEEVERAAA